MKIGAFSPNVPLGIPKPKVRGTRLFLGNEVMKIYSIIAETMC